MPTDIINNQEENIQDSLSDREIHLLKFLAQGKTNQEIARELNASEFTTRSYILNVLNKLHFEDQSTSNYSKSR